MRFQISREVLAEDWSLSFSDLDFVNTKPASRAQTSLHVAL